MDAIAADKHKLSMEGLLKLEEKMSRVERGLERDSRELNSKLNEIDNGGDVSFCRFQALRYQRITSVGRKRIMGSVIKAIREPVVFGSLEAISNDSNLTICVHLKL